MVFIRAILLLLCLGSIPCSAGEPSIWMGMTRAQVEDVLGFPESRVTAGNRSLLFFKEGARFEFENGILISVRGYKGQIEYSSPLLDKARTAAVSETPNPVTTTANPTAKQQGDQGVDEKHNALDRRGGLPNYKDLTRPAVTSLEQVTRLFYSIYSPVIFDAQRRLQPLGLPILAGLIRIAMTLYALRFAIRRTDHDLDVGEIGVLASLEWILRVLVATLGVFVIKGGFHMIASELVTTLLFWWLVSRRPEISGFWLSLRITVFTRLAVFLVSFVLFMLLLNLGT